MSKAQDAYEKMMQQGKIKKIPMPTINERSNDSNSQSSLLEMMANKINDLEKRIKLLESK